MLSVERVHWARMRVAAITLVSFLILTIALYLLTGGEVFEKKASLYFFIPDASGLSLGAPVEVDGITAGKVTGIALSGSANPQRAVKVTIGVAHATLDSIPPQSLAQLRVGSLVGDKFVYIVSAGFGERRPNSEIRYDLAPDMFASLDMEQFTQQVRQLDAVLRDIETGRSRVGQFVLGTDMYNSLRKRFTQVEQDIRTAARTTSAVGQALYTDSLYRQIMAPLVALDGTLARIESGQGDSGRFLRDAAQYAEVRAMVSDLRHSVATLAASPLMQSDDLYRQVNAGLQSAIDGVAKVNRSGMLENSLDYDNLTGFARQVTAGIRDFRSQPEKYLRYKIF